MNEDMAKKIQDIYFSNFKENIKEGESLEEYLLSKNKNDVERVLKIDAIISDDKKEFNRISSIENEKEQINELTKRLHDIYSKILKNIDINIYDQLEDYVKKYKNKKMIINLDKLEYSPLFIQILSTNLIAKVNYNKEKNNIEIYSPEEIINVLKELLKDKSIEKECENNTKIIDNIKGLISTYGAIELSNLIEIYKEVYDDISKEDMTTRILINSFYDEELKIVNEFSDYLIYGLGFESDKSAQEFLMKLPKKLAYKVYTKKQYDEIREGSYFYNIDEYDTLHDFLSIKLHMSDDDIFDFGEMFVLDYMYSYQIDSNTAKRNLNNNLEQLMPYLDFSDKAHICKMILSIAKNYPNFNFKGHTYNEVGDKYR